MHIISTLVVTDIYVHSLVELKIKKIKFTERFGTESTAWEFLIDGPCFIARRSLVSEEFLRFIKVYSVYLKYFEKFHK